MSTRATIQFKDDDEEFYVYRDCDGFPENILLDLQKAIEQHRKCRYGSAELGMLVTHFLGMTYAPNRRVPDYEITKCFHGDESYRYFVSLDSKSQEWQIETEKR